MQLNTCILITVLTAVLGSQGRTEPENDGFMALQKETVDEGGLLSQEAANTLEGDALGWDSLRKVYFPFCSRYSGPLARLQPSLQMAGRPRLYGLSSQEDRERAQEYDDVTAEMARVLRISPQAQMSRMTVFGQDPVHYPTHASAGQVSKRMKSSDWRRTKAKRVSEIVRMIALMNELGFPTESLIMAAKRKTHKNPELFPEMLREEVKAFVESSSTQRRLLRMG